MDIYNSSLVKVVMFDDFHIEFNFGMMPMGRPILLLISPSLDAMVDKGIYLFEDFVINFDVDLSIIFTDDLDLGFSDVDGQAKLLTPFLDFIDK